MNTVTVFPFALRLAQLSSWHPASGESFRLFRQRPAVLQHAFFVGRFTVIGVNLGVEGKIWEDIVLETSPPFWQLIEKRRKQRTLSLKELKARLTK